MLPFQIHHSAFVSLCLGRREQGKTKSSDPSPDHREKSLFYELVLSLITTVPNTQPEGISQDQLGEWAFPLPLERGMLHGFSQWLAQ